MAATYLMSLNSKFTFGKYKGFTLEDILNTDPKYVRWCIGDAGNVELSNDAYKEYEDVMNELDGLK